MPLYMPPACLNASGLQSRVRRPSWPCLRTGTPRTGRQGRGTQATHILWIVGLFCVFPIASLAQAPPTAADTAASHLSVYLLTMGPGDMVYERFGHNAILIEDR